MPEKSPQFFVGRVIKHPAYVETESADANLSQYTDEFVEYWKNGFSPMIGKDSILEVPDIYSCNAIGRAHVEPAEKDPRSHSSTELAWELWAVGDSDLPPTSNSFLIYCVADNRDCCLLHYLDQGEEDSHDKLCEPEFRASMRDRATEFFRQKGLFPMEKEEHKSIFSEKWVNPDFKDEEE